MRQSNYGTTALAIAMALDGRAREAEAEETDKKSVEEEIAEMREKILTELRENPKGRKYIRVSDRLRYFLETYLPEVEIKKTGGHEIVRMKRET